MLQICLLQKPWLNETKVRGRRKDLFGSTITLDLKREIYYPGTILFFTQKIFLLSDYFIACVFIAFQFIVALGQRNGFNALLLMLGFAPLIRKNIFALQNCKTNSY